MPPHKSGVTISYLNKKQLEALDKTIIKIIEENPDPSIVSLDLFEKVCASKELYADTQGPIIFKRFHTLAERGLIGCYGDWRIESLSYYKKSQN